MVFAILNGPEYFGLGFLDADPSYNERFLVGSHIGSPTEQIFGDIFRLTILAMVSLGFLISA